MWRVGSGGWWAFGGTCRTELCSVTQYLTLHLHSCTAGRLLEIRLRPAGCCERPRVHASHLRHHAAAVRRSAGLEGSTGCQDGSRCVPVRVPRLGGWAGVRIHRSALQRSVSVFSVQCSVFSVRRSASKRAGVSAMFTAAILRMLDGVLSKWPFVLPVPSPLMPSLCLLPLLASPLTFPLAPSPRSLCPSRLPGVACCRSISFGRRRRATSSLTTRPARAASAKCCMLHAQVSVCISQFAAAPGILHDTPWRKAQL